MHNRVEHQTPRVIIRMPDAIGWRQQWAQSTPDHLQHIDLLRSCLPRFSLWPLGLSYCTLAPSVMVIARPGLMPAPPVRPAQYGLYAALDHQDQLPEQAPDLGTA